MFEPARRGGARNALSDWMFRGGIALIFVFAGIDKFSPSWIKLFRKIGFGQWFRYFTGVVWQYRGANRLANSGTFQGCRLGYPALASGVSNI